MNKSMGTPLVASRANRVIRADALSRLASVLASGGGAMHGGTKIQATNSEIESMKGIE